MYYSAAVLCLNAIGPVYLPYYSPVPRKHFRMFYLRLFLTALLTATIRAEQMAIISEATLPLVIFISFW
jgi:hypothetical protein